MTLEQMIKQQMIYIGSCLYLWSILLICVTVNDLHCWLARRETVSNCGVAIIHFCARSLSTQLILNKEQHCSYMCQFKIGKARNRLRVGVLFLSHLDQTFVHQCNILSENYCQMPLILKGADNWNNLYGYQFV